MKTTFKIERLINNDIKVGDTVVVNDGSSLTSFNYDQDAEFFIVNSYPEVTGVDIKLINIPAKVIEIGI